ncbi:jg5304 [Pararge aegeria aegeria]|uniref:Jg5304 protein n=1 Tax=Pararge aegeria aegeria TaxID=348720 RepID=A0A8S4R7H9_9NEOP|nr:jg5304 [Pararge aegeria aegeria]
MRGSTAGLADSLSGGPKASGAFLEFADVVFASVVVAPAVVTYWKSTWSLMDLYVLPRHPVASAAACSAFGLCCGFVFCVYQTCLATHLRPGKGKLLYYVVSRLYTCVAGAACVGAWRGVWNLLNECTGDSARTLMSTTVAATLSLAALRTLRNISAAPFAVAVDSPQDYFDVPTMFRTVSTKFKISIKPVQALIAEWLGPQLHFRWAEFESQHTHLTFCCVRFKQKKYHEHKHALKFSTTT